MELKFPRVIQPKAARNFNDLICFLQPTKSANQNSKTAGRPVVLSRRAKKLLDILVSLFSKAMVL